ncbi:hypothetical protein [Rhodococcoides fascians]|uniref:hypothetical protein n=1 Tax=Rhodococcoides fascians TaxID=1828 RepID=UPI0006894BDD|nr:hypothetical protein [Rhodococcus fascians]
MAAKYKRKGAPLDITGMDRRREAAMRAADAHAVITHTTAILAEIGVIDVRVLHAGSHTAELHINLGPFFLIFRNAAAVHGFISAFASVRSQMFGLTGKVGAPLTVREEFAMATLAVVYLDTPKYHVENVQRYSETQRRPIHWVELVMGPVTWRIVDHDSYDTLMEQFRTLHRVSVGAFADGGRYRRDPTKVLDAFDDTDTDTDSGA